MAAQISTKPPSGTRDFLPDAVARRRFVIERISRSYELHGFLPLETPAWENLTTLLGKGGDEGDQLIFRIMHRRDALKRALDANDVTEKDLADLGLRFDLTVPFSRVVAQYRDLPRFFKRYQIQPVWRADRPGRGRYREFYQCDVDTIGSASLVAEAEVCSAVTAGLESLGFQKFIIQVNHRQLLRALLSTAGVAEESETGALAALDKLEKIGESGVRAELAERGIGSAAIDHLFAVLALGETESNSAILLRLESTLTTEGGRFAIADLRTLLELAAKMPLASRLVINPTLARGLSYYTGCIFEIVEDGFPGSLAGGGRYDKLIGMFGSRDIPAVGFSLGLERVLLVMEERGMFPDLSYRPELLLCWLGVPPASVLEVASRLREQGVRVEVFPEEVRLKKQLEYAAQPNVAVPFVGILGETELNGGTITLKQLATGHQETCALSEVALQLKTMHQQG